MSNKELLEKAAQKFIDKVESGEARSVETYRELKLAMNTPEDKLCRFRNLNAEFLQSARDAGIIVKPYREGI